jgi:hypothetical protein
MGTFVVAAAAGAARAAEIDLLERFRVADATAADRAQPLSALGVAPSWTLTRYLQAAVVRQTVGDRYYLDERAYAVYHRGGPRAVALVIAGVMMFMGMAVGMWMFYHGRPVP